MKKMHFLMSRRILGVNLTFLPKLFFFFKVFCVFLWLCMCKSLGGQDPMSSSVVSSSPDLASERLGEKSEVHVGAGEAWLPTASPVGPCPSPFYHATSQ